MSDPITDAELAEIRALADACSPEPWRNGADPSHFDSPEVTDDKTFAYYVTRDADAAFIAASRTAVPRLLDLIAHQRESPVVVEAERDELRREVERLRGELAETRVALEAKRAASQTCRGNIHVMLGGYGNLCQCQRTTERR